jgi:phage FluMu protein Com
MPMSQDEFEANYELIECRDCGTQFNLGAQHYYDNKCPECKE